MATPRKASARSSKAAKKPVASSKKVKKAGTPARSQRKAAGPAKPAAKRGKAPAPVKTKKAVAKPVAATKGKIVPRPAAAAVKAVAGGRKRPAATAEVRPLGVLPPGSIARGTGKPAAVPTHPATSGSRPAAAPAAGAQAQRVTGDDLKGFEQRLLEERRKISKEMGHLENTVLKVNQRDSAGDLSGYSFHMADVGTDAMEREKAFLFASAEGRTLLEINEALRRLYRGDYGMCENCGQPIGRARLEAMPHARLCLSCKEKEERTSRGAV